MTYYQNAQTSDFKFPHNINGMTLIELMLVVVIIGILALVIIPTFQNQIRESRRADGIKQLLRIKLQQEAYRTQHPIYATTIQLQLPINDYYSFSVTNVTISSYELIATAKGEQKKDAQCKVMSINQSMHKKPADCFR